MKIIRFLLLAVVFGTVFCACENTTPPEYRRLFNLPLEQQATEFQKFSPDQQVEIFWYALRSVEPPATHFGNYLAANRRKVLPPLLAKLRQEKDDWVKYQFVEVLETMHREHCSLKDDREVHESIRNTLSTISNADYREWCERTLTTIREKPSGGGPC